MRRLRPDPKRRYNPSRSLRCSHNLASSRGPRSSGLRCPNPNLGCSRSRVFSRNPKFNNRSRACNRGPRCAKRRPNLNARCRPHPGPSLSPGLNRRLRLPSRSSSGAKKNHLSKINELNANQYPRRRVAWSGTG